jgi:hypothetical protein
VNSVETVSLKEIIKNIGIQKEFKITKIENNQNQYTIYAEIKGSKDEINKNLIIPKNCNIVSYQLQLNNSQIIVKIVYEYLDNG